MSRTFCVAKTGARMALLATVLVPFGAAQMGGGMMGPGTPGSGSTGTGSGMSSGMNGGMGVMSSGMAGMTFGPAVGPDGTAYVVRFSGGTTQGMMGNGSRTTKTELVALNPLNGTANWTLQIDGTMISEPVLAKDGTVFLTTSEPNMRFNNSSTEPGKPALVIVSATATTARVLNRVGIDADVLSTPRLTPDGQTVYVVAAEMPNMTNFNGNSSTQATGGSYLYAFWPDGRLKFKVQLAQFSFSTNGRHM